MKKVALIALAISINLLGVSAPNAQVKKWIDKDGKVHYGDSIVAPVKSEDVKIADSKGNFKTEVNLPQTATKNKLESLNEQGGEKEKLGLSPSVLKVCLEYGKQLSARGSTNMSVEEANRQITIANSLKTSCPGVKIRCTASTEKPEGKTCEPVKATNDGVVFEEQMNGASRQVTVKK